MTEQDNQDDKKVSFTADHHPYLRTLYDLPFTREISRLTNSEESWKNLLEACKREEGLTEQEAENMRHMATIFEARYKSSGEAVRKAIEKFAIGRGLEIAAGFSQRGLEFSLNYPNLTYVESDISEGFKQKPELIRKVVESERIKFPANLSFASLDALKREDYRKVLDTHFPNGQAMFIYAEGLLAYWDESRKAELLGIVHDIFTSRPGSKFISPDFSMHNQGRIAMFSHLEGYEKLVSHIVKKTGRDYDRLAFPDEHSTARFIDQQKWVPRAYTLTNLGVKLVSPNKIAMAQENREVFLKDIDKHMKAWVLTPSYV